VRRRYLARFDLPDGTRTGFTVFEDGPDGWSSVTVYPRSKAATDELDSEIEKVRRGVRLYKRK